MLGFVILWPHLLLLIGMPGADALAFCPQTGTICLNCSELRSWKAWNHLIEKRSVTPDLLSGTALAATVHLPDEEDCPALTCLPLNC